VTSKLRLPGSASYRAALLMLLCGAMAGSVAAQQITVQNEAGVSVKMTAAEIAGMRA
jgi:hypothetical protein